ncbi:MAG: hypothetical protein IPH87_00005, partial [Anaerolineae bacterium]|nr:hypothetical protein [Anaerolineae bacterium]
FIIATDHNVLVSQEEGWHGRVLLLVGEEVNDASLQPEINHCLVMGVQTDVSAHAAEPQALINAAHSQERSPSGPSHRTRIALAVRHLRVACLGGQRFHRHRTVEFHVGISLLRLEQAACFAHALSATLLHHRPLAGDAGKMGRTATTRSQPIVAIGGSDAHAHTYHLGPLQRLFLSYRDCFAAVNTHLLVTAPLNRDVAHDRALIYDALRAGHAWVGYDLPGATRGFRFTASNGQETAIMGDALAANGQAVRFEIITPGQARTQAARNGQVVAQARGTSLSYASPQPGIYRVEAWRRAWGKARSWVFSNPIYVK